VQLSASAGNLNWEATSRSQVSVEERYTEQLINGALAQKPDESVAQYGLRARVYKERLSQLPESVMCKYFVNGLKQPLRQLYVRDVAGRPWEDLDACILFAIGREAASTPANTPSASAAAVDRRTNKRRVPAAAFLHARGHGRGRRLSGPYWQSDSVYGGPSNSNPGRGRGRGRGGGQRRPRPDDQCGACEGYGHWANECPNKKRRQ
jgi:hypothetical protein